MRVVIQRVDRAAVSVEQEVVGRIGKGLVLLLGVTHKDTEEDVTWLAEKCVKLRIFEDDNNKFNFSLADIQGEVLVVSQFTLYGDCRRGRRPSFTDAAPQEYAEKLYNRFVENLRKMGFNVQTGIFGANMLVEIHNKGPVTLVVDTEKR